MTADERATLARVERLLAEYQAKAPDDLARRYLLEPALTALRGLLAEPQVNPSEAICPQLEGAVEALRWIAERYEWDASGCPAHARTALQAMGVELPTTGAQ